MMFRAGKGSYWPKRVLSETVKHCIHSHIYSLYRCSMKIY